jgi:hypothetical protein
MQPAVANALLVDDKTIRGIVIVRCYSPLEVLGQLAQWFALPALRHPFGGKAGVFVAGEAEADEPLFVKVTRRLLQQRHAAAVVLDQVVVGGEDIGYASLNFKLREFNFNLRQPLARKMF